jgi:hypothetical protein
VGDSSQPDCFAHICFTHGSPQVFVSGVTNTFRCGLLVLEERYSQQRLPDELAQNIAGWCHDCARMRITEQTFDV